MWIVLLSVTSIYTLFMVLMLVFITFNVVRLKTTLRIHTHQTCREQLQTALRGLGNFGEYTPLALILMAFCELNQAPELLIHLLGLCLVMGRVLHWIGICKHYPFCAKLGMGLTYSCLIGAICLLGLSLSA